jgi:transcriptional regulator with XRE-family HTH domain
MVRRARTGSGLSLRRLARLAGTSQSTLPAYEAGHVDPSVDTMQRIVRIVRTVRAVGFDLVADLRPRVGADIDRPRGDELVEALELAPLFPPRRSPTIEFPKFDAP